MATDSHFATVEQDAPSKVPVLTRGNISLAIMWKFEDACITYFNNKDIAVDKQVRRVISGLQDDHIWEWLDVEQLHLMQLTFEDFMAEFCASYLLPNWEDHTHSKVLSLTQGQQTFWNYTVTLQSKNVLLANTPSHLTKEKLQHQLEANMEKRLKAKCCDANTSLITDFTKWLQDIKHLEDGLIIKRTELQNMMKASCNSSCKTAMLAEPSHRFNTAPTMAVGGTSSKKAYVPKLTTSEKQLLSDNEGCFKCRSFFVTHRTPECPTGFPDPVTYWMLTATDVESAKQAQI